MTSSSSQASRDCSLPAASLQAHEGHQSEGHASCYSVSSREHSEHHTSIQSLIFQSRASKQLQLDVDLEWNGFCFPSEGSIAQSGEVRSRKGRHGKVSITLLLRPQPRVTESLWGRKPLLLLLICFSSSQVSQVALVVKNPPANAGDIRDVGSIPGSGRSPGREHGTHSRILAWRIPRDSGAWQATVHRVTKSQTWLKWLSTRTHTREGAG